MICVIANLYFFNLFVNQPQLMKPTAGWSVKFRDKPRGEQLDLGSLQCWFNVDSLLMEWKYCTVIMTKAWHIFFHCQRCFLSFPFRPRHGRANAFSLRTHVIYDALWSKDFIIPTLCFSSCFVSESHSSLPLSIIGNCKTKQISYIVLRTWALSVRNLHHPPFDCEFILRG
jgi:hypothetical protein